MGPRSSKKEGRGYSRSLSDELLDCLAFAITLCPGKLDNDRNAHYDRSGQLDISISVMIKCIWRTHP